MLLGPLFLLLVSGLVVLLFGVAVILLLFVVVLLALVGGLDGLLARQDGHSRFELGLGLLRHERLLLLLDGPQVATVLERATIGHTLVATEQRDLLLLLYSNATKQKHIFT